MACLPHPVCEGGRRRETEDSCAKIHGATDEDQSPLLDGLWVTLVNKASANDLQKYLKLSTQITKRVLPALVKDSVTSFNQSTINMQRSCQIL